MTTDWIKSAEKKREREIESESVQAKASTEANAQAEALAQKEVIQAWESSPSGKFVNQWSKYILERFDELGQHRYGRKWLIKKNYQVKLVGSLWSLRGWRDSRDETYELIVQKDAIEYYRAAGWYGESERRPTVRIPLLKVNAEALMELMKQLVENGPSKIRDYSGPGD